MFFHSNVCFCYVPREGRFPASSHGVHPGGTSQRVRDSAHPQNSPAVEEFPPTWGIICWKKWSSNLRSLPKQQYIMVPIAYTYLFYIYNSMYIDQPKSGFHDRSGYLNDHCHPCRYVAVTFDLGCGWLWSVWHAWHQNKTPNSNGLESPWKSPIFHLVIFIETNPPFPENSTFILLIIFH